MGESNRPPGRPRVLGLARDTGAAVALDFLATTGASHPTPRATTATVCFLILSRRTFATRGHDGRTDGG